MRNILKQFGARATVSFKERFNLSIIRLTVFYSLTLALILAISSFVSYSAFSHRILHRFSITSPIVVEVTTSVLPFPSTTPTPEQLREDLVESLLLVNISLLGLAIILSYLLAKKTLEPIKRAYENQERFLSDVSHELRTPIAILQTDLENDLLREPGRAEVIESKLEEVRKMGSMVSDILTLSRLSEDAKKHGTMQDIALQPMVEQIVKRLSVLAERSEVTCTVVARAADIHLKTDERVLATALTNIIKNAILYNKQGGTVTVELGQHDDHVSIAIVDTGVGIESTDQGRVFDRFYRVDKSRTRETGGTGLGLAIAESAVYGLGGKITLVSKPGNGTTVTITLHR